MKNNHKKLEDQEGFLGNKIENIFVFSHFTAIYYIK